jgi:hypothetical protein
MFLSHGGQEFQAAMWTWKCVLRTFRWHPSRTNLIAFRHLHARAQRTVWQPICHLWEKFVCSVSNSTPSIAVWECMRQIWGKCTCTFIPALLVNGVMVISQDKVAEMLSSFFESASKSASYASALLQLKHMKEATISALRLETQSLITRLSLWQNYSEAHMIHPLGQAPFTTKCWNICLLPPWYSCWTFTAKFGGGLHFIKLGSGDLSPHLKSR